MQISRNIVNAPKSNNKGLVGIWVIVCTQKPSHHFLSDLSSTKRMFKFVFRDSSFIRNNCYFLFAMAEQRKC